MKRTIAILLLAAMLGMSACGSGSETVETTAASEESETSAEPVTTADPLADDLPSVSFEGYKFRILGADNDIPMLLVEEMNGSLVNDKVYDANRAVEERFEIELTTVKLANYTDSATIKSMILSGSDDFDLGVCHDMRAGDLSMEELFVNLRELPYLDFDKPWWPEFTCDGLTVNGKMYIFSNYIGYNGLRGTKNMYVNLDKLKDYDMKSPYDMVRDGTWTLDNMISLSKDIYVDLNGDGKNTIDDFHGFAFTGLFYGWLENFGIEAYTHTSDRSEVELTINTPRSAELVETLKDFFNGGEAGVYWRSSHKSLTDPESYPMLFANNKSLFTYGSLYVLIDALLESTVTYGILPMPKYDETQEYYYGVCYDSPMWVPVTVSNPERTGIILEAMSAEGYRTILPAYKDIALKNRYAVDLDSSEMLDIIFDNRVLSFSYIYGGDNGFQRMLNTLVPSDTLEFASYYASNESTELARVEKINAAFAD